MRKIKYIIGSVAVYGVTALAAAELNLPRYPLQTTGFVQPNVMILFDNSNSMVTHSIDGVTRLNIAKQVAQDIVNDTPNIRFCLAIFNPKIGGASNGGTIAHECALPVPLDADPDQTDLGQKIADLTVHTVTPLANTYQEILQYFEDGDSLYLASDAVGRSSPIQYRCQKNYTIVMTDGEPFKDDQFKTVVTDKNGSTALYANYDASAVLEDNVTYDSDGNLTTSNGRFRFLDDIAMLAYDSDLRSGTVSFDDYTENFDDPLFPNQNMYTYTVAFDLNSTGVANTMLRQASEGEGYGHGKHYVANDAEGLEESFTAALQKINTASYAVASSTANGVTLTEGLRIFQSRYTETDWSGQLYSLTIDPSTYEVSEDWVAPVTIEHEDRVVFSAYSDGVLFADSNSDLVTLVGSADVINFIRGDDSITGFRDLSPEPDNTIIMGDIVNSSPVFVAAPGEESDYEDETYSLAWDVFYATYGERNEVVFVGANDGMLHGFDAQTGAETMAFIPSRSLPYLEELTQSSYEHRFFVDGSPSVKNVYYSGAWHTVLVGGLARGGQGIYAIDVTDTNPDNTETAAAKTFLWEFSDTDDADLGFTYSQPQIMRLNDGNFYVVFASGYNNTSTLDDDSIQSTSGDAVIYILDIQTGGLVAKLSTQVGIAESSDGSTPNGMGNISGADLFVEGDTVGEDGLIDYLYAGDLFGNLWKFDLNDTNSANWGARSKLFSATDRNGNSQPITVAPTVVRLALSQQVRLFFGTGKNLEAADSLANTDVQTFYSLLDTNVDGESISGRSELLEQSITYQNTYNFSVEGSTDTVAREIRLTSDNSASSSVKGWYIDLREPLDAEEYLETVDDDEQYQALGEKITSVAVFSDAYDGEKYLSDGQVYVTAYRANSNDLCQPATKSFLMTFDPVDGSRFASSTIDNNKNGAVDSHDNVTVLVDGVEQQIAVSGIESTSTQAPVIIDILDSDGYDTKHQLIVMNNSVVNDAASSKLSLEVSESYETSGERISWRELRSE